MVHLDEPKTYVDDPGEAPTGTTVEEGPRGGLYYETSEVATSLSGGLSGLAWDDPNGRSFTVVDEAADGTWVLLRDDGRVYDGVPREDVVAMASAGTITQAPDEEDDPGDDYTGAEWVGGGEVYRVQRAIGNGLYEVKNLSSGAVSVEDEASIDDRLSMEDDDGDGVGNDLVGETISVGGKRFDVLDVREGLALIRGPDGDAEIPEDQIRSALQSGRAEIQARASMRFEDLIERGSPADFSRLYGGAGVSVRAEVDERGNEFVKVRFTITDPETGRDVGTMLRSFNADGSVEHDTFVISSEHQGRGLAARLNERAEESYRAAGLTSIYLNADIDVGKYVWALQGYDFRGSRAAEEMRGRLRGYLATKPAVGARFDSQHGDGEVVGIEGPNHYVVRMGDERMVLGSQGMRQVLANSDAARFERLSRENGGLEHAWDFAALDDGKEHAWSTKSKQGSGHLGKAFLLSDYVDDWDGAKSLEEGSPGYAIGQRYYERGRGGDA
jgi:GNAT superfamily N-acetyltransferase